MSYSWCPQQGTFQYNKLYIHCNVVENVLERGLAGIDGALLQTLSHIGGIQRSPRFSKLFYNTY